MSHAGTRAVIFFAIPLCIAGCGDVDRRPGDVTDAVLDAGGRDAGTGDAGTVDDAGTGGDAGTGDDASTMPGDLVDHPRTSIGTTELSYNFLDTVTFETARPPSPYSETVTVTPNADLTELTVELGVCTGTGNYTDTNEDGEQRYEMDLDTADCAIMVNGEIVDMVYSGGRIYWGPEGIRTFFNAEGTITNSTSLVIVEHN